MRELFWGGGFTLVFCLIFFSFVLFGWPGDHNACIDEEPNTCFCEEVVKADIGKPGIRQPFNTLSNFYVLATGTLVGIFMAYFRKRGVTQPNNRMQTTKFYPIMYLILLLYLGLGSMWLHASFTGWGGVMDQVSMFTYSSFLVWYTVVRMTDKDWPFYVGYPITVILFTILGAISVPSELLIGILVGAYVILQAIIWAQKRISNDLKSVLLLWLPALLSFILAAVFQILSNTDGPLCLDPHGFQFHGVWHWLAGVTAVLLYFYFQRAPR